MVVAQEGLGLNATERYKAYSKFACLPPVGWLFYIQKMPHSEDLNTSLWHEVWSTRSIEGLPIRALNSKSSLREEGKAMDHLHFHLPEQVEDTTRTRIRNLKGSRPFESIDSATLLRKDFTQ